MNSETITTAMVVTALVGVIAPILVGLVTKVSTSASVKAVLLAAISAATGVGTAFQSATPEHPFAWQVAVFNAIIAFVIAVAFHFGLYKPETSSGGSVSKTMQNTLVKDNPDDFEDDPGE